MECLSSLASHPTISSTRSNKIETSQTCSRNTRRIEITTLKYVLNLPRRRVLIIIATHVAKVTSALGARHVIASMVPFDYDFTIRTGLPARLLNQFLIQFVCLSIEFFPFFKTFAFTFFSFQLVYLLFTRTWSVRWSDSSRASFSCFTLITTQRTAIETKRLVTLFTIKVEASSRMGVFKNKVTALVWTAH